MDMKRWLGITKTIAKTCPALVRVEWMTIKIQPIPSRPFRINRRELYTFGLTDGLWSAIVDSHN